MILLNEVEMPCRSFIRKADFSPNIFHKRDNLVTDSCKIPQSVQSYILQYIPTKKLVCSFAIFIKLCPFRLAKGFVG